MGTHLERLSSLKAWIVMRVMFTDIRQKGNCWNGVGKGQQQPRLLPSGAAIHSPARPAVSRGSHGPEATADIADATLDFCNNHPISQIRRLGLSNLKSFS